VAKDDRRISASYVEYASPQGSGTMRGYLVQPRERHRQASRDSRGARETAASNPHIEDIARRLALDNFLAFARPTASIRSAAIPATKTRHASSSRSSIRRKRARTSWLRRIA
jgi:carboxymethylenebutenolidase